MADYFEFKSPYQASLIGTTIAGRFQNGALMSVVVGEVNFTPDSNIDFHVSALGKETVYTYLPNDTPALQYQFINGTEESGFVCGPPYIGGLYQINSNTEAHPADYVPTAPAGDYDVEIRMWFEDRLNRYKGSSTEVLKLHVTSGATSEDTGTVSFISSTVEPPDLREPLTAPEISIQGVNVSISQAEGKSVWYTTDGTNPVPGPNPEAEIVNIVSDYVIKEGKSDSETDISVLMEKSTTQCTVDNGAMIVAGEVAESATTEGVPDGTYYFQVLQCLANLNIKRLGLTSFPSSIEDFPKLYTRLERNVSEDDAIFLSFKFLVNNSNAYPAYRKTNSIYSLIDTGLLFTGDDEHIAIVFFIISLHKTNTTYNFSTLSILNPVIVNVTANQALFASKGYNTDEEIQDYLDSLSYAEFAEYSEGITTQPNGTYYESPFAIEETSIIKARATDYTGEYRDSDIAVYEAVPTPSEVTGPFSVKKISQLPFGEITEDTKFLVENNKSFYQGSLKDLREYLTFVNVELYKRIAYPSGVSPNSSLATDINIIGDEESERFLILYPKGSGSSKEYVFGYYNDLSKAPVTVDYPSQANKTSKPTTIKYFEGRFYARFSTSSSPSYKWYVLSGTSWAETTDPEDAYEGDILIVTSDYVYTKVGRNSCPGHETPGEVYRYTKATGQYEVVTSSIPQTSNFTFLSINVAYGGNTYLVSDSFYSLATLESGQSFKLYYTQNQGLSWTECESSTEGWMLYSTMGVGKYQGKYCIPAILSLTGGLNEDSSFALALSEDGIHFQIKEDEIMPVNSLYGYPPLYVQGDRFSYDCMSVASGQEIKINLGFNVEQFLPMKGAYVYTGKNKIITFFNRFLYYLPV